MTELKKWENEEILALLRSELQSVEDLTDTGKLDDVVDEIERRLDLKMDDVREIIDTYSEGQLINVLNNQMRMVTAEEFSKLHKEKLGAERKRFRPLPIYIIPSNIAKILDEAEVTADDSDIPQEVIDWVNELKDDYINWSGRMFLVFAYCNPLTSPKAFPNIWKFE